ncbi:MAG: hypothetical protein CMJ68_23690 [Planctomycetaceae bacterium]|nr:hypothetical protein [Planctomycetaceae bacterium]
MIRLRRGNRLPTVAVVQAFLNDKREADNLIAVDGIFGPETQGAVRQFQQSQGLRKTGTVENELWSRLVGKRWQVIDHVDRADHASLEHEDLEPFDQTILEQFGMTLGGPGVVRRVAGSARNGKVALLRFHGHGGPGQMIVASGRRSAPGSSFSSRNTSRFDRALQSLRPIFAGFGSIELHGCRVGRGTAGRVLLTRMANATGVPVTAGRNTQFGGGTSTFQFEGPTRTIAPGGQSLKHWARAACQACF